MKKISREPGRLQRAGSALLVTLLVVSLLLVTVLTFVVVVRQELRKVINHQELLHARANARLGLNMAVAKLQEHAGPDTRGSFSTATLSDGAFHPSNRYWTGIMDTSPYRYDPQTGERVSNENLGSLLGWLVSGYEDNVPDPLAPTLTSEGGPAPGFALLVGPGSSSRMENHVAAGLRPVQNATGDAVGEIAWWVGEENSKAQVNLIDPFRFDGEDQTEPWRHHTAQRTATEILFPGVDPGDALHQLDLQRASSPAQIALGRFHEPADVRGSFHDFTLFAHGLPTHPVRGGLKRDLTPVLEETLSNANGLPGGGTI